MDFITQIPVDATMKTFAMVSIAEIFDKTWFVALLMALKYDKVVVFWACFLGLAAHVAIAAVFGYAVAKMIPIMYLNFGAAVLYAVFACLFYKDYQEADPEADIIAAGKEEAGEDCEVDVEDNYGATDGKKPVKKSALVRTWKISMACFITMFIAEWGDRTQIAMIGAAASQPLSAVVIGSLAAFFVLTLSAVIVGSFLGNQKLSEKTVHLVSAISFVVFAILAVRDGIVGEE